jgi:hypothetical protein
MAVVVGTPTLLVAIDEMAVGFEVALIIACVWGALFSWPFGRRACFARRSNAHALISLIAKVISERFDSIDEPK